MKKKILTTLCSLTLLVSMFTCGYLQVHNVDSNISYYHPHDPEPDPHAGAGGGGGSGAF